jgi:hypothetical protein
MSRRAASPIAAQREGRRRQHRGTSRWRADTADHGTRAASCSLQGTHMAHDVLEHHIERLELEAK